MRHESSLMDRMEKSFFNAWLRINPLLATSMGFHDADSKLPPGGMDGVEEEIKILRRYLKEFMAIAPDKLSPSRAIDRDLAVMLIRQWLFEREDWKLWESCPAAPRVIGESIFQILSRNYAPLQERIRNILSRMEKLPKYLEQARERLTRPIKQHVQIELDTITRLPGFFNILKDVIRDNVSLSMQKKIARVVHHVQEALEQYTDWLIIDVLPKCREEFAMGEDLFLKRLRLRGIAESPGRMISAAEAEIARQASTAHALAKQIRKRGSLDDVREELRSHHPATFDEVLKVTRSLVTRSRQFVEQTGFATLPPNESLYVIETPMFLRHLIPYGSCSGPALHESKQEGYYLVTPGDSENDKLKDHNHSSLSNMAIHEAYPGHQLQNACANTHPSLIRSLCAAPETTGGWALYCESLVKEMEFEDSPQNRLVQTSAMIWRAVRTIADIRLNTGRMGIPEARNLLTERAWLDRYGADSEVSRYILTPTVPLSYFYGMEKIESLKKYVRQAMKGRFTDRFFHDTFLYAGRIPLSLMKREFDWKIKEELNKKKPSKEPPPPVAPAASTKHPARKSEPRPPVKKVKRPAPRKKK